MKFVVLPCLRCGKLAVPIFPLLFQIDQGSTFSCHLCEAQHYLSVIRQGHTFLVCYQRYALRYPLECYDDRNVPPPIIRLHAKGRAASTLDSETFTGPIVVYPRKRRFSPSEVETIWRATKGRCHICSRRWPVAKRGAHGWHIDHVIPHIGGGHEVEELPNFRVACAKCNLKKGKGYTEASVRLALRDLVKHLAG